MRTVRLLVGKDLRTLLRSRTLALLLIAYPLVIAALIGSLLLSASEGANIGLVVEDRSGGELRIGDDTFGIERYKRQAENSGVDIVDFETRKEAMRALDEGQVAGVLVIPPRFISKLQTALSPAELQFYTGDNALGNVITQRIRGVIYRVNLQISASLIELNSNYLKQLVTGGEVEVTGDTYELFGLRPARETLERVEPQLTDPTDQEEVEEIIDFAADAEVALGLADDALDAAAAPVRLVHERNKGKSPQLTARAMSFALGISLAFICVIFVAASLASERDEQVLGRLVRGLASTWQVVLGKLVLGVVLAIVFSLGLFAVFAVLAPQAWTRLPLLLLAVALAALSFSAVGALLATLTRDARTATLVGLLLILPLIPMAQISSSPVAHAVSQFFPLDPAQGLFNATLFDLQLQRSAVIDAVQLAVITIVAGGAARSMLRRLT